MSFTNVYYKRQTGTPKACYVCYKPTTTVLATIDTVDFIYTCPGHLQDQGFATKLGIMDGAGGGQKMGLSAEEIAKVKEEWEEKQRKKAEKEKEKEAKEAEKDKDKSEDKDNKEKKATPKSPASPPQPATPKSTPTHERYALHRDFFAMRQAEHRKRKQAAQAKALAPQLPRAPTGTVEDKY